MILTGGSSNPGGAFVGEVRTPIERTTSRIGQAPPALEKASRADQKTASDARNTTDHDAREHPQSDRDPEGVPRRQRETRHAHAYDPRHHHDVQGGPEDAPR